MTLFSRALRLLKRVSILRTLRTMLTTISRQETAYTGYCFFFIRVTCRKGGSTLSSALVQMVSLYC